ncbi:MAG: protein kinase domain-containing protein [Phycisphaerales bacterium]
MAQSEARSQIMVLVFTDIVDSVAMKKRLGDAAYFRLLEWHNGLFDEALARVEGAQVIKMTGDGFLARFPSASAAAQVALIFQALMADQPKGQESVVVRTGIHVGEAMEVAGHRGQPDVIGFAVDTAARIMSLAMPGQILLTRTAFDDARQYIRTAAQTSVGSTGESVDTRWLAHGAYLIKGTDEPMEVYEVGTIGKAPLRAPPDSEKAKRAVRADEAELLGWRPAPRTKVPGRPAWMIEKKLGEGGFGEVWLITHEKTREQHVLKFCFDAERLRFLRRELTIFRVLRESLGDRPDIVRIHDVRLEQPPYYLESAYSEIGNLLDWAASRGGLDKVPTDERIDVIARTADAVGAAHGVGVLHKDLKPANILLSKTEAGVRPQLADFGIGLLSDAAIKGGKQITMAGFTMGANSASASSSTGTPMYMAPEVLAGQPFTTQADVYALGVMLYQMTVGDLRRPLGQGWEREAPDPELRDDIRRAVSADLRERFTSAVGMAKSLRDRPRRRAARIKRRLIRTAVVAVVGGAVILGGSSLVLGLYRTVHLERERTLLAEEKSAREKTSKEEAINREREAMARERESKHLADLLHLILEAPDPRSGRARVASSTVILDAAAEAIIADDFKSYPAQDFKAGLLVVRAYLGLSAPYDAKDLASRLIDHAERHTPGTIEHADALHLYAMFHRALFNEAVACQRFEQAEAICEKLGDEIRLAESRYERGVAVRAMNDFVTAEKLFLESIAIRERFPDNKDVQVELARTYNSLARLHQENAAYAKAVEWASKSLEKRKQHLAKGHRDIARAKTTLGQLFRDTGQTDKAWALLTEARDEHKESLGDDSPEYGGALIDLALAKLARNEDALDEAETGLQIRRAEHLRNGSPPLSTSLAEATIVHALARLADPDTTPQESSSIANELRAPLETYTTRYAKRMNDWRIAFAREALGRALLRAGKPEEAQPHIYAAADAWTTSQRSPLRARAALTLALEHTRTAAVHADESQHKGWTEALERANNELRTH